jgi:ABC-type glycerol-3-phosphate transport system permease component
MVGLALLQGQYLSSIGVLAAGLLLSVLPPLTIFVLFQRNLATGLTAGAVK